MVQARASAMSGTILAVVRDGGLFLHGRWPNCSAAGARTTAIDWLASRLRLLQACFMLLPT